MKFAHTRDCVWSCGLVEAVDGRGNLRTAFVVVTPFERHFREFYEYRGIDARLADAVEAVADLLMQERWYRRPRRIECCDAELGQRLEAELRIEPEVRVRRSLKALRDARTEFERHARETVSERR